MEYFTNDYEKAAYQERCAFKNLISLYDAFPGYEYKVNPASGKEVYDVLIYKLEDGKMTNRIFIEIKIRDCIREDYMLETKKYNSIIKLCKEELYLNDNEYKIFYLNFTPIGTYLFNCNIVKDIPITYLECNKSTCNSRYDKVNKSKWDLPLNKAIRKYDYIFDQNNTSKYYNSYIIEKVEQKIKKVGLNAFFDNLNKL